MFFYFSLFGATRFRGRLGLGRDYILNNYGTLLFLVDDNLKNEPWSTPGKSYKPCALDENCGREICVASNKDNLARTFKSIHEFLYFYHYEFDGRAIRSVHVGLGKCSSLFGDEGKIFKVNLKRIVAF